MSIEKDKLINSKKSENVPPQTQNKRVLIVDDDYYFRLILEKSLNHHHYQPVCAENAKHAQQMIGLDQFDIVISDIRMPEMTGIELLHWIKSNYPKMPVILMTGFSEIIETQEAVKLGADGFLPKPFKTEDLLKVIEACLQKNISTTEPKEEESLDSKYCKISMDDFISGKEIKFDIYVRITELKYVKIAHGGENLPAERIKSYKDKKIQFLYMDKEDFKKYLGFNLSLVQAVTQSKNLDFQKKANFVKHTSEVLLQSLYVSEINREDYLQAGVLVENAVSLLNDNSSAADLLFALSSHTDFLYAHSVGVSLYASLIGKALGWTSPTTTIKLSIGGLLHDIGKKEIPRAILEKSRKDLTPEDVILLESHPVRGAEILAQLQCVPTDILQITHQHHENCQGFGYPLRLKKSRIHPLAKVIAVANEFCNLVIKNPNSPGLKPAEAIQRMLSLNPECYDAEAMQALMRVFKIPMKSAP